MNGTTLSVAPANVERERALESFLEAHGWGHAARAVLAQDASFRRYDRLTREGETAVLMDAPPPQENVSAFHKVAQLLLEMELSAPRPLAIDTEAGFMLLEDFGDRTFTRALAEGSDEAALYRTAVDLLIALHRRCAPERLSVAGLPPYDEARLLDEALLLTDWYLPAVRATPTPEAVREGYVAAWRSAFRVLARQPATLVLRDFHVDNLILVPGRQGIAQCGLLDFQDALAGPASYDLVSLLEDARRDVSPEVVRDMLERYLAAFPVTDRHEFLASYAVLGAQRNAKIVGIFTRLCQRDKKPDYLRHIPRLWRLLAEDLKHPALAPVRDWFERELPAEARATPDAERLLREA